MLLRQRSDNLIILTILGVMIGLLYSFAENALKGTEIGPLMIRAISCTVLVFLSISFAARLLKERLKGKTFFVIVLLQTMVYILIITFWLAVINGINDAFYDKVPFTRAVIGYLKYSGMYLINVLTVFIFLLIIISLLEINTLHRKGELVKYIFGLYRKPKEVDRVFMFADIKSSTAMAEKIGNVKFGMLLQEVFSDFSNSIEKANGEVYGYVGDEIIISWKYSQAVKNNQCIRCFFEMQNSIQRKSADYIKRFGVVPEIKAGIHAGKVVVMWVGDQKKEIVYLGDVLNTTSRIQAECNRLGEEFLASGQVINQFPGLDGFTVKPLGQIELRGKEEKVLLFGIKESERTKAQKNEI